MNNTNKEAPMTPDNQTSAALDCGAEVTSAMASATHFKSDPPVVGNAKLVVVLAEEVHRLRTLASRQQGAVALGAGDLAAIEEARSKFCSPGYPRPDSDDVIGYRLLRIIDKLSTLPAPALPVALPNRNGAFAFEAFEHAVNDLTYIKGIFEKAEKGGSNLVELLHRDIKWLLDLNAAIEDAITAAPPALSEGLTEALSQADMYKSWGEGRPDFPYTQWQLDAIVLAAEVRRLSNPPTQNPAAKNV